MKREASSYRDPDGYVAYFQDDVYRCVLNDNAPVLLPDHQKFFEQAVRAGLLIPFERTGCDSPFHDQGGVALKLEKLPLITYPYEWGFEQMKEAALATLDIALLALDHGLSIKDATAFNVQQYKGRMVFIDHTSFEKSDGLLPWRPYSQFCRHFIVPLLMTSRSGRNANKLFRLSLDGIDLAEACSVLPLADRFRPSVFIHIYLHNYLIDNFKDTTSSRPVENRRTGNQKAYLQHLRHFVGKIAPPRYDTEWHDYYNNTNYRDESFTEKEQIITRMISQTRKTCIWDVGGNNGHFSRLMADHADMVVSMDIDYAAIDLNFLKNRQEKRDNVYPVVMDLTNPSPALGFANNERSTIDKRAAPDLVVALALIHHLSVTYNVPFSMIARQFFDLGADLLIEFVDRGDSQFKKLLRSKNDSYDSYNRDNFEKCFFALFDLIEKSDIRGTERTLYHLKPKRSAS